MFCQYYGYSSIIYDDGLTKKGFDLYSWHILRARAHIRPLHPSPLSTHTPPPLPPPPLPPPPSPPYIHTRVCARAILVCPLLSSRDSSYISILLSLLLLCTTPSSKQTRKYYAFCVRKTTENQTNKNPFFLKHGNHGNNAFVRNWFAEDGRYKLKKYI